MKMWDGIGAVPRDGAAPGPMARFMVAWELDKSKVPVDPKERAKAWSAMLDMVDNDMKRGGLKDWAAYAGQLKGYSVAEGSEMDVAMMCQQYVPFVDFKIYPLTSVAQMRQMLQAATK